LFNFLKYEFLLSHLPLHIFEFLGEILARVLPLPPYLSLSGLEVADPGPQLAGLTVLPVYLFLHRSDLGPLLPQLLSLPRDLPLQFNQLVAGFAQVTHRGLTRRLVRLRQVLQLPGLFTELLMLSHQGLQLVLGLIEGLGEGLEVVLLGFTSLSELFYLTQESLVLVHYFIHS
jgi:hypothetical protein